ncbi:MAG TPA: hypothetical protein VHD81_00720 [Mycobacteriales bacterium]|nr:hypothetical protein [Mycobacteriales bacterium]
MGLFSKVSEMRMKDPAEGTLRVVGISMPDPTATSCNYRMDGVVSADGLLPTAVVHHGMCSTSRWPSAGDTLPVTVDRSKPERIVVHWKELPTGAQTAQSMAEQLATQMRGGQMGGGAATVPGTTTTNTTVTVNGQPVNLGAGMTADLGALIENAVAAAGTMPAMAGMAGAMPAIPTVSNDDILSRGTPGNATLLGTFPPPVPVVKEGRTGVGLMLNVMVDGKPPYQIQNVYAVPQDKVAALKVGSLLPVRADQTMPNLVAIDWDSVHP